MKRVFFDSSVLVAATASLEGASALILGWCKNRKLAGYMSADVLGEAKKNVAFKLGASYLSRFEDIVENPHLGKPLSRELSDKVSFRVGVYRVVYKVNRKDNKILILRVGHRSKVYS